MIQLSTVIVLLVIATGDAYRSALSHAYQCAQSIVRFSNTQLLMSYRTDEINKWIASQGILPLICSCKFEYLLIWRHLRVPLADFHIA